MSILAYCVSLAHHFLDAPPAGIGGAEVFEIEDLGLRAWYSEVEEGTFSGAEHVTKAALEFHHFVSAVFREGTVLPFRFPSILESVEDLREHLEERVRWYSNALQRSEGLAQFEARIVNRAQPSAEAPTGTEYLEERKSLRERSDAVVSVLLKGLDDYIRQHHAKESRQGTRLYLLTDRTRLAALRDTASKISIPEGFEIRLTGPWPPTEFLPADGEP